MKRLILVLCIGLFFSCLNENHPKEFPEIVIVDSPFLLDKYDLKRQVYTVYFIKKPPFEVKFNLTEAEKDTITQMYYDLGIDKIPNRKIFLNVNGFSTPVTMDNIIVTTKIKTHEFILLSSPYESIPWYEFKFKKAAIFHDKIIKMIRSKPEIKNAPRPDFLLM